MPNHHPDERAKEAGSDDRVKNEPPSPEHVRPPMDEDYDDDESTERCPTPQEPKARLGAGTQSLEDSDVHSFRLVPVSENTKNPTSERNPRASSPASPTGSSSSRYSPASRRNIPSPHPETRAALLNHLISTGELRGELREMYGPSPAELPPETPANLVAPTPGTTAPTPFASTDATISRDMPMPSPHAEPSVSATIQAPDQVKMESPAETLKADTTPDYDSASSPESQDDGTSPDSGSYSHRLQPSQLQPALNGSFTQNSNRRMTRGSLAAAAQAAQTVNAPIKKTTPEPGAPVQASVNCWILTNRKDWVLPPPRMGVSLADLLPGDVIPQPWMHHTRHPILWDQKTDPGGKSGKNLVTIGAAAAKASVNGRLPAIERPETYDGLHLLMDFGVDEKPTYSYALITRFAILGSPHKSLSLGEIYLMLEAKFPWFLKEEGKWKDSIRYNLSSNNWFVKTKRALHQPGIGSLWMVDEASPGGPKRPRKGRNKGTAFTDVDDDGDENSQDESTALALSQRNGTLMLTFDSKQKIPLDKFAAERGASGHANHNSLSRVGGRAGNGHLSLNYVHTDELPSADPYAEARASRFIGAANAAIERTRETAELQRNAPKDTPAPPWMTGAVDHNDEDSGIGSGRDDDSDQSIHDACEIDAEVDRLKREEDGGSAGLRSEREQNSHNRMDEDLPSPASPPRSTARPNRSAGSNPSTPPPPPITTQHHLKPCSASETNVRNTTKHSSKPASAPSFQPTAGTPVTVPSLSSVWNSTPAPSTSSNASDPPPAYTPRAVPAPPGGAALIPQQSPRRALVSSTSSMSTTASVASSSRSSPEPFRVRPIYAGQHTKQAPPTFKRIAPTATVSSSNITRSTVASSIISPYMPETRKRKNIQASPTRPSGTDEDRKKLRKIDSSERDAGNSHPLWRVGEISPMGPPGSSISGSSTTPKNFSSLAPSISSSSTPSAAGRTAQSGKSARGLSGPPAILGVSMRSTSSSKVSSDQTAPTAVSSPQRPTAFSGETGLITRPSRSFEGTPFALQTKQMSFGRGINWAAYAAPPEERRASESLRLRRSSGSMDIDPPLVNTTLSTDSRSRMDLDESDDDSIGSQDFRMTSSGHTPRMERDSVFTQATKRHTPVGSALSVTVPTSSSRMERDPPTPTSAAASRSPTVANLVSPISGALPSLTSVLGQRPQPESRTQLAPIQHASSHHSPAPSARSPPSATTPSSSHPPTPTLPHRQPSAVDFSRSVQEETQPSTFGPPFYYGFIVSDTPPISTTASRVPIYTGGDADDTAVLRYSEQDWRD